MSSPTSNFMHADFIHECMQAALEEAQKGSDAGEVPVGAVIADSSGIIARAHNLVESEKNAALHAEMLVMKKATQVRGDWRLTDCTLFVTLEPCTMCTGALKLARIPTLVYGTADEKMGACGGIFDLSQDSRVGHSPRVISGVLQEECAGILKRFFKSKRQLRFDQP